MNITGKVIVAISWLIAIAGGLALAGGLASGNELSAGIVIFGFAYIAHVAGKRIDKLERRLARLEQAFGDHQRWHNHRTDY